VQLLVCAVTVVVQSRSATAKVQAIETLTVWFGIVLGSAGRRFGRQDLSFYPLILTREGRGITVAGRILKVEVLSGKFTGTCTSSAGAVTCRCWLATAIAADLARQVFFLATLCPRTKV
jgi:hypothetical protein